MGAFDIGCAMGAFDRVCLPPRTAGVGSSSQAVISTTAQASMCKQPAPALPLPIQCVPLHCPETAGAHPTCGPATPLHCPCLHHPTGAPSPQVTIQCVPLHCPDHCMRPCTARTISAALSLNAQARAARWQRASTRMFAYSFT